MFDSAEELVVAVLRQLTGGQTSKDGISESESAGWRLAYLGPVVANLDYMFALIDPREAK